MMIELFWLLLPIAAFSGWWIGRYRAHDKESERPVPLPVDYLRGLNFLLNEQPDKAVDVFLKMVEVDSETVETHLALGSLFRRRGEVDRAIRIHQNLIARPNLSTKQRLTALYHLGLDYMGAGVLDRAENLFTQLVSSEDFRELSLRQLLEIYQQQRDWEQAIKIVEQLESEGNVVRHMLTHLHCELVEEARTKGSFDHAQKILKRANTLDATHFRVQLLQAQLLNDNAYYKQALKIYAQLVLDKPESIPLLLPEIAGLYQTLGKPNEFVQFLREKATRLKNEPEIALLLNVLFLYEQDVTFIEETLDKIHGRANLWSLRLLILIFLEKSIGFGQDYLQQLKAFVEKLMNERAGFQCRQCGFSGHEFYWQCPSCKTWDTVKPVHGSLLFELHPNQTLLTVNTLDNKE